MFGRGKIILIAENKKEKGKENHSEQKAMLSIVFGVFFLKHVCMIHPSNFHSVWLIYLHFKKLFSKIRKY
jgi:hypothetical protein